MLLTIDIGNSHVVIGCMEGREVKQVFRMVTDTKKTEDEYCVDTREILSFYGVDFSKFDGAIIASVVPQLVSIFKSAVKKLTGLDAMVVGAGMKTGMNIKLDNPAQLGSDLAAAGVAAMSDYKLPVIIFDMGTATTVSVINEKSDFLGGAIIPGLALSVGALASGTSLLQSVPIEAPKKCISSNTIDCMKSGAVFGTAAMLDGMIDRMEEELGTKATIVATGGLSKVVLPYCRREIIHDEDLLLRGLAILYEKNKR